MAIVFIDACGYSLAVRETEMRTLSTIRADLNLASEVVVALGGEVTGIAGDGFCATFRSVSVAVEASLRVQETLSEQVGNYDRGFRIGVHVGDTFEIDRQIIGNTVNTAARIESAGSAGDVLVSSAVRNSLQGGNDFRFVSIGYPTLKNLGNSLELFKVIRVSDQGSLTKARLELIGYPKYWGSQNTLLDLSNEQTMLLSLLACSQGVFSAHRAGEIIWEDQSTSERSALLERLVDATNEHTGLATLISLVRDKDLIYLNQQELEIDVTEPTAEPSNNRLLEGFKCRSAAFMDWLQHQRSAVRCINQDGASLVSKTDLTTQPTPNASWVETTRTNFVIGLLASDVGAGSEKASFVANIVAEQLSKSLSETEALIVQDYRTPNVPGPYNSSPSHGVGPDLFLQCRASACESMLQVSVTAMRPEDRKVIWNQNVVADQGDFLGLSTSSVAAFVSYATDALLTALVNGRHMRDPAAHHAAKTAISAVHHLLTMSGPGLDHLQADILAAYEIDPKPVYLAWLAYFTTFQIGERYGTWDIELEERARELARRAVEADADNGTVLGLVAHVYSYVFREFSIAQDLSDRALELSPYRAMCWDSAAMLYCYTDRPRLAVEAANKARVIGRHSPYRHLFDGASCVASLVNGDFEQAVKFGENVMAVQPQFKAVMRYLAASYGHLGDHTKGEKALHRLVELEPDMSLTSIREDWFPVPTRFSAKLMEDGLSRIGLPKQI
ncbi:hypothetical protein I5192_15795 [Ruegeria sp. SCSIO 43209]|uniref:adenylate/guanylate cyclase domain-containing protein n=1 Tax=Ruegeria sp. SCSIO 43209 TaxID=2793010 RepID=UPI001CA85DF4|nr:adenylate/guanylate cyclase domain-containing protein [Ruegeria sp. SCSIO 43209]UAB88679.1 hypothetical protein I5192_15795 [Ruegeria sp. SCSIO 43209]